MENKWLLIAVAALAICVSLTIAFPAVQDVEQELVRIRRSDFSCELGNNACILSCVTDGKYTKGECNKKKECKCSN